ncbi:MAG: Cys-tRNA(Pro) deacylase [Proteobacteria bacterium]|nr:MAG: Cys-tRNA(Pro) deacylase [Pseudomonadota bacterium]
MAKRPHLPTTRAVLVLREAGVDFEPHVFRYEPRGGTRASAAALGVDEHRVIKTLVMSDEQGRPVVVLMHGDRSVSTKALARELGHKSVVPCAPVVAERHSGYKVGGTSPFGTVTPMPVYVESSILDLERIYINGGSRGFLVEIDPWALVEVLGAEPVDVAIARR